MGDPRSAEAPNVHDDDTWTDNHHEAQKWLADNVGRDFALSGTYVNSLAELLRRAREKAVAIMSERCPIHDQAGVRCSSDAGHPPDFHTFENQRSAEATNDTTAKDRELAEAWMTAPCHHPMLPNCKTCEDSLVELLRCVREEERQRRERATDPAALSYEDMVKACRNIGFDLDCGACASLFYTGYGGYDHEVGCKLKWQVF